MLSRALSCSFSFSHASPSFLPFLAIVLPFSRSTHASLSLQVCNCDNDWMSPSGSLPFLRLYNNRLLVGTEQIQRHLLGRADRAPAATLDAVQAGVMRGYIAMLAAKCHTALMFELWCEDECR